MMMNWLKKQSEDKILMKPTHYKRGKIVQMEYFNKVLHHKKMWESKGKLTASS